MHSLRAGIVGAGYLGCFHAMKYANCPDVKLAAVADIQPERARRTAAQYGARACGSHLDLAGRVDVASVVVPTPKHFEIARDLLHAGVHVLVEKPFTATLAEARHLLNLAEAEGCVLQVGHIERFNAVTRRLAERITTPIFLEAQRISPFRRRGTDTDVVFDLMIHDIDLIHSLVKTPVKQIHASGGTVLSSTIDVANARIQFENGCIANLTASRVSRKSQRSLCIFQTDSYLAADFKKQSLRLCRKKAGRGASASPGIKTERIEIEPADALQAEINAFLNSVRSGDPPVVNGHAGLQALQTATEVLRQLETNPLPGQRPRVALVE